MNSENLEKLVTIAEAARVLAVGVRTIYRKIEAGDIKPVYVTPDTPRIRLFDLMRIMQG